jgi:hypothetical protein
MTTGTEPELAQRVDVLSIRRECALRRHVASLFGLPNVQNACEWWTALEVPQATLHCCTSVSHPSDSATVTLLTQAWHQALWCWLTQHRVYCML